jgi:hypothetical protein
MEKVQVDPKYMGEARGIVKNTILPRVKRTAIKNEEES